MTSKDVKYAIERSNFAPDVLANGPTYFKAYLAGGDKYQGPYKDKTPNGLASIETPDDSAPSSSTCRSPSLTSTTC